MFGRASFAALFHTRKLILANAAEATVEERRFSAAIGRPQWNWALAPVERDLVAPLQRPTNRHSPLVVLPNALALDSFECIPDGAHNLLNLSRDDS